MPDIAIILGSGLSNFSKELITPQILSEDKTTFHHKKVLSGQINGENLLIFEGRNHFYEGFENERILMNVRKAIENSAKLIIITNAAGGINKNFEVSDIMLASSHLNFINRAIPGGGSSSYKREIIDIVKKTAHDEKLKLRTGVYCALMGPAYETSAEYLYLKKIGADAVGMSTVPEVLFASSHSIRTITLSCITNLLREGVDTLTTHDEVIEAGKIAYENFSALLKAIIKNKKMILDTGIN